MAGIILGSGIAEITKNSKGPTLMEHTVGWEKTNYKHTNKQDDSQGGSCSGNKVDSEVEWTGDRTGRGRSGQRKPLWEGDTEEKHKS